MSDEVEAQADDDEREAFYSDLDVDDIAEAFIGALLAGLVIVLVLRFFPRRGGRRGFVASLKRS